MAIELPKMRLILQIKFKNCNYLPAVVAPFREGELQKPFGREHLQNVEVLRFARVVHLDPENR